MTPEDTSTSTPTAASVPLWHSMAFRDADAMAAWLTAVGFTEHATHRDPQDPALVVHAEWLWPGTGGTATGGIMFGSRRDGGALDNDGRSAAYLVVAADADVDAVHDRAVEAGGTSVRPPTDQDYGGRGATVEDPEGNHWSIGSYQPS